MEAIWLLLLEIIFWDCRSAVLRVSRRGLHKHHLSYAQTASSIGPSRTHIPSLLSYTMSGAPRILIRRCAHAPRLSSRSVLRPASGHVSTFKANAPSRRSESTDAAAAPSNPKIAAIVDQISGLTLLETADLVSTLKVGYPEHSDFRWTRAHEILWSDPTEHP